MAFCTHCGSELEAGAAFCNNCGARLEGNVAENTVQVPTTHSPDKKNNKLSIIVIVIVIVIIIAMGIGVFAFLNNGHKKAGAQYTDEEKAEMFEIVKNWQPFAESDGVIEYEGRVGDVFEQYFGNNGEWTTMIDEMSETGIDFSGADVVYFGMMSSADFKTNDLLVSSCEKNAFQIPELALLTAFGFTVDGDDVECVFVYLNDGEDINEEHSLKLNADGAISALYSLYALTDKGISYDKSIAEETRKDNYIEEDNAEYESDSINEYDPDDLIDALVYYYKYDIGYSGTVDVEIEDMSAKEVSVRLYDHTATTTSNNLGYYTINIDTATATDDVMGDSFSLKPYVNGDENRKTSANTQNNDTYANQEYFSDYYTSDADRVGATSNYVMVNSSSDGYANIRYAPSIDSDIKYQWENGTIIDYLGETVDTQDGRHWHYVGFYYWDDYDGEGSPRYMDGYISSKVCELVY